MSVIERRRALTLADVAREARVGESTVSRVLRGHGSIAGETRERVREAVARLGYVPNRIAGTLASTGSKLVGIIVPSLANVVFPDVLRGANGALAAAGYQAVIAVTEYDPASEEALIESVLAWRPAGLLVAGLEHTERATAILRGSGVRIAELLDIDGTGIDFVVGFSNREAGEAAARHLLQRGYRRIGYVGHDIGRDLRAGKRLTGFADALAAAGAALVDHEIVAAPSSIEAGRAGMERLLARNSGLDAVYFSNDDMAIGAYFLCLSRGIAMPSAMALFGHNGLDIGRATPQPLSTIRTPRILVGERAAALVCSDDASTVVDLGFDVVEGATT